MPRVKGLAFRSVMASLEELEGPAVTARAFEALPEALRDRLRGGLLLSGSWYPLDDYVTLWQAVESASGSLDLAHRIGRQCAHRDLHLIHRLVLAFLSPLTGIRLTTRLFGLYYDTGQAHADYIEKTAIRATFEGCRGFSSAMWREIAGSIEMYAELGTKCVSRARVVQGGADGNPNAVIDLRWDAFAPLPKR